MSIHLSLLLAIPGLMASSALAPQPLSRLPSNLQPLVRALETKGFTVLIALPPVRGSYGLYKNKTLWISPITLPLGIARQTFLHEAVHAIQSCPTGTLKPLGLKVNLNSVVEREVSAILRRNYHQNSRILEREAFSLQGHKDTPSLLLATLNKRCI